MSESWDSSCPPAQHLSRTKQNWAWWCFLKSHPIIPAIKKKMMQKDCPEFKDSLNYRGCPRPAWDGLQNESCRDGRWGWQKLLYKGHTERDIRQMLGEHCTFLPRNLLSRSSARALEELYSFALWRRDFILLSDRYTFSEWKARLDVHPVDRQDTIVNLYSSGST